MNCSSKRRLPNSQRSNENPIEWTLESQVVDGMMIASKPDLPIKPPGGIGIVHTPPAEKKKTNSSKKTKKDSDCRKGK